MANRWYYSLCGPFCRRYDPFEHFYELSQGDHALNALQANAMGAIIEPMMTGGSAQWPLYMAGALFAIILWMVRVPPLAFALGTYLPMKSIHRTNRWFDCVLRTK